MKEISGVLQKEDLELMKVKLTKAWFEDFYAFCMRIGGTTAEVMGHILKREADYRTLLITLNSFNTEMGSVEQKIARAQLYPAVGYMYPDCVGAITNVFNEASLTEALKDTEYKKLYDDVKSYYEKDGKETSVEAASIEDVIYKANAQMYEMAFEQQYHFGIFYAWVKLREQEIRNIRWTAEMVVLDRKESIDKTIVPIFEPRA